MEKTMKKTGFVSGLVLSFLLSALCGTGASAAKPISAADSGSLASQIVTVIIIVIAAMLLVSAGIAVMIILLVTRSKRRSAQNQIITPPVSDIVPANYTEMIGAEIRKTDPDFSGAKFCDWGKNVFIRMLDSISDCHLAEMKSLETDTLFRRHENEINNLYSIGQKNFYSNIYINRAYLQLYVRTATAERLTMYLSGMMQNYPVYAATGQPLPNYSTERREFKYLLTFDRKPGSRTRFVNGLQAMTCHNCGAPVENVSDIRCRYCGSELLTCENNWTLSDVYEMKDNRPVDDRGVVITDRVN